MVWQVSSGTARREGDRNADRLSRSVLLVLDRPLLVRGLWLVVASLTLLSLAGQIAKYMFGHPTALGAVPFFYLDLENNLPTWYQSFALLFAAGLLAVIAVDARRSAAPFARQWMILSLLFVWLSVDEMASFHERTIDPLLRLTGGFEGAWRPTWVLLAVPFVAILGLYFLRFIMHFPSVQRTRLLVAGALYVGGAVGVEMATAAVFDSSVPGYKEDFSYALMAHAEEVLEMVGAVVFIDFLCRYVCERNVACTLLVR